MNKNKKVKSEPTLDAFYRAIRTYDRDTVSDLMQHGILNEIPKEEKIPAYRQLVALQNMEIMHMLVKHEGTLDPEIFNKQSESSQSKVFINQCLSKFYKHFAFQDDKVCDTLFTLSCDCGCYAMLNTLVAQKKCQARYPELGSCPLDILKKLKPIPSENLSNDALVSFYFEVVTTNDCERKLEYLCENHFDIFVKNSTGKSVVDLLDARIKENRYPKNRHGSLLQIEDKKMLSKLNKLYCEKMYPEDSKPSNNQLLRYGIALSCIALLVIVICATASLKNNNASGASNTESVSTYVSESDT